VSRLVQTGIACGAALLLLVGGMAIVRLAVQDRFDRYNARSIVRWSVTGALVIAVLVIWHAFRGDSAVVVGLIAGGLTFALQEVVGAVAGWINILAGRIYRVGDRIEIAGVQGDVIDITPLRTKIMEIGAARDLLEGDAGSSSWVKGRQTTGRIVAMSNKTTFQEPVFNYSSSFDFVFEELTIPVPYRCDWRAAEQILLDEAHTASSPEAESAMARMAERYPIARDSVEPRVFTRATDNWVELSARFAVAVRTARQTKADMTRRILARFEEQGIEVASATSDLTVRPVFERPDE
jgi:small-conductance mechanosensitive channel